jgi:hypothetical protein
MTQFRLTDLFREKKALYPGNGSLDDIFNFLEEKRDVAHETMLRA